MKIEKVSRFSTLYTLHCCHKNIAPGNIRHKKTPVSFLMFLNGYETALSLLVSPATIHITTILFWYCDNNRIASDSAPEDPQYRCNKVAGGCRMGRGEGLEIWISGTGSFDVERCNGGARAALRPTWQCNSDITQPRVSNRAFEPNLTNQQNICLKWWIILCPCLFGYLSGGATVSVCFGMTLSYKKERRCVYPSQCPVSHHNRCSNSLFRFFAFVRK